MVHLGTFSKTIAPALRTGWAVAPRPIFELMLAARQLIDLHNDRMTMRAVYYTAEGFLAAVRAGLGWGMLPELQLGTDLADGSLDLLEDHAHHDVALYWQSWALDSPRLHRITECVRRVAREHLRATAQDG